MTQNTVRWSRPMDPKDWGGEMGISTAKVTVCQNRFELLASSSDLDSEAMRKWAHERLDEWLDKR